MEIWKDIEQYKGFYQISNQGRVRSLDRILEHINPLTGGNVVRKGKVLKQRVLSCGYSYINLCVNDTRRHYRVHRLVALAFIPNPNNKPQINHKNGVKTDNRVHNLEWATSSENILHSFANGFSKTVNKKSILCIDKNISFESSYKAAEWLNNYKFNNTKLIKPVADKLRLCASGQRKIAYGFRWKFID